MLLRAPFLFCDTLPTVVLPRQETASINNVTFFGLEYLNQHAFFTYNTQ